ncbi:hypothetical protein [Endozoicomonas sp. OPT23]|uniref:hypothetical protein n=1 Tax=Endozoicomonas sp. OPT23 TaxID=2072845 RepID=UPI00129B19CA|nr:hypothetical protein [Endozoicomonas sp. OPT23]
MKYKIIVLLVAALTIAGCSSSKYKHSVKPSDYTFLDINITTQEDVRNMMGEPIHIDNNSDGRSVFLYSAPYGRKTALVFSKEEILEKILVFEKDQVQ